MIKETSTDTKEEEGYYQAETIVQATGAVPTNLGALPQQSSSRESDETDQHARDNSNFINHGLARWEQARNDWLQHAAAAAAAEANNISGSSDEGTPRPTAVPLEVDEIIDVIFSPRWRGGGIDSNSTQDDLRNPPRRFPTNVPLPQMVDVLVDLWEAEGLDT